MDWLISLIMLVALEAVLGIDNLLYIAIESGRVDSSLSLIHISEPTRPY